MLLLVGLRVVFYLFVYLFIYLFIYLFCHYPEIFPYLDPRINIQLKNSAVTNILRTKVENELIILITSLIYNREHYRLQQ